MIRVCKYSLPDRFNVYFVDNVVEEVARELVGHVYVELLVALLHAVDVAVDRVQHEFVYVQLRGSACGCFLGEQTQEIPEHSSDVLAVTQFGV